MKVSNKKKQIAYNLLKEKIDLCNPDEYFSFQVLNQLCILLSCEKDELGVIDFEKNQNNILIEEILQNLKSYNVKNIATIEMTGKKFELKNALNLNGKYKKFIVFNNHYDNKSFVLKKENKT